MSRLFPCAAALVLGAGALLLAGCGPGGSLEEADAAPPDATLYENDASPAPETLSQSGLYANTAAGVLAPGVRPYEPRYELWSDGAEKRRWIYIPEGARIDDSDGDFWIYPEGTRVWKEFSSDGVKVETRLLYKQGPEAGDWYMMAYVWNESGTDAVAAPLGERNARGTSHRVPSQEDCRDCHEPMEDAVLGFSAVQLDRDPSESGAALTLQDLVDEGKLRVGTGRDAYPHYPLPGTESEREILGYLHGNCGGCHNRRSPIMRGLDTRPLFTLPVSETERASVDATPAYDSTVEVPAARTEEAGSLIAPGDPQDSAVYLRMDSREPDFGMPPLGSAAVDEDALGRLESWIESLPESGAAAHATPAP